MENNISAFNVEPQDTAAVRWERWIARFENLLVAKNITGDNRKKALLLHHAGEEVFDLYFTLQTDDNNDTYTDTKQC